MRTTQLIAVVAILLSLAGCIAAGQSGASSLVIPRSTATPEPTREPLGGESIFIYDHHIYMPGGIFTEESESVLEDAIKFGKSVRVTYRTEGYYDLGGYLFVKAEISLPEKVHVSSIYLKSGFIWPPGFEPEDPRVFNAFYYGAVHFIVYKNERAVVSHNTGRFLVGEKQTDLFWFLFEQLGDERAVIIPSESYEEWWELLPNTIPTFPRGTPPHPPGGESGAGLHPAPFLWRQKPLECP